MIPPMLEQRIQQHFFDSADLQYQTAETLARPVAEAAQTLVGCITAGGKVLVCAAGAHAALGLHVSALLVGRFERDRPALGAMALSADSAMLSALSATGAEEVYAKQVQALGQPGDVLLVLDDAGQNPAVLRALEQAHAKDMPVIALTGRHGGLLKATLNETDVHVAVPHDRPARVLELHLLVLHCLCDAVDLQLLGEQDT